MIKVLFVCLGNICRSPMAEAVFRKMVSDQNLQDKIFIDSAATSSWEDGNPVHHGTKKRLAQEGIGVDGIYSRILNDNDLTFDYIIGMDKSNIRNINSFLDGRFSGEVNLLMHYAGKDSEIADPYYTGNFNSTYNDVHEGCFALLQAIKDRHGL